MARSEKPKAATKRSRPTTQKPAGAKPKRKPARRVPAKPPAAASGDVAAAVERELDALRKTDSDLADGPLAAIALELARELDKPEGVSTTAKTSCARVLRDTLDRLRELTPVGQQRDGVSELKRRRAGRQRRSAT